MSEGKQSPEKSQTTQSDFPSVGLALEEPHASWIYLGVKDCVVTTEDYTDLLNQDLLLVGEHVYGTIKLKEHSTMNVNEFKSELSSHRITESERRLWARSDDNWTYGPFHKYSFEFTPFESPRVFEKPRSKKSVMKDLVLKEEVEDDFIFKPKGPWGDGFKECIAWVKRNKPGIDNPQAWCAEVYHRQEGNKKKEEEMEKEGRPKTDAERAKAHFNISDEEWEELPPEKRREYIEKLPDRGQRVSKDDVTPYHEEPCPCPVIVKHYIEERPSGYYLVREINGGVEKELKFSKESFRYEEIVEMSFVKELLQEGCE